MRNLFQVRPPKPSEEGSEEGYMLLAVICMLALLTIALTVAVPDMTKSIQRDQEVETMHRGMQYRRAIQLYYRKYGSYPPSINALVKTNNIRFLRKRYLDPITRKDDWKPIIFGQNKAPLAMGFFGQPLGGLAGATPIAGTGPSGGNTSPGAGLGVGASGSTFGSSFGGGSTLGSGSSLSGSSSPGGSSIFSSDNGSTSASPTGTSGSGSASASNGSTGSGSTASSGNGFMSGQNGQTFGGAGIVGFEPGSPKKSILLYKKKDHYNQWEFTYSPLSDVKQQAGGGSLMGGSSTTGNGTTSGTGLNSTGTFGGGSSFGGSNNTFGGSSNPIGGSSNPSGGSSNPSGGSSNPSGGSSNPSGGSSSPSGGSSSPSSGASTTPQQ